MPANRGMAVRPYPNRQGAFTLTQTGTVTKLLDNGMALVNVERGTACGGNCASCGGTCSFKNILTATAANRAGAVPGDRVTIQSQSSRIIGAAAMVYLTPVLTFLLGYGAAAALGAAEGVAIAVSVAALLIGCGGVALINRRRKTNIRFEIISIES